MTNKAEEKGKWVNLRKLLKNATSPIPVHNINDKRSGGEGKMG